MATVERSHVGFRGPTSIPLGKHCDTDPSQHINQLQFNLHAPYSINSLASNFQKPQPLLIEKFPVFAPEEPTKPLAIRHGASIPSSPASSVCSERLHFAVQLAKIDAKKLLRERKELEASENVEEHVPEETEKNDLGKVKTTRSSRKSPQDAGRPNVGHVQYKSKRDHNSRRNQREHQFLPNSDENDDSEQKQTREIRRLEKQIQSYLQRLDGLMHKGQEVIQKKDKRLHGRRNDKDDISHLSDEDTDPRQYERAEEQATRSARVLYMIERQIQELDDEIRKKGKHMKASKKSQTLGRLAAAQRATVRALRMLINSAPLQPKRSQHYPSIYQALTSLIQQLSLLAIQIEGGDDGVIEQNSRFDNPVKKHSDQKTDITQAFRSELPITESKRSSSRHAFTRESAEKEFNPYRYQPKSRSIHRPLVKEIFPADDSVLTVDPTPERNATLKAGLEALLRAKENERKTTKPPVTRADTKKKSLLLPPTLQAKRRKAYDAVQKKVKFSSETVRFTKDTTASRLKKVEKQKTMAKGEMKSLKKPEDGTEPSASITVVPGHADTRNEPGNKNEINHKLREHEIQRQLWLEDESRKKLREVMDIPSSLVSEAEEAIKMKLKPLLDQAQAVVDSSKSKPVQDKFASIASKATMQENEVLSEMILDDLLLDTAHEFRRLERSDDVLSESAHLENSSTLENILQRLEYFEKEEEEIRQRLNHVTYTDTYETKESREIRRSRPDKREYVFTKEGDAHKKPPAVKTSTMFKAGDKEPVPLLLPPKVRDSIFSYRKRYSEYLEKTNAENQDGFDPWQLVERLTDDILEEAICDVAGEFSGACDDVTEMIFKSEFMKE